MTHSTHGYPDEITLKQAGDRLPDILHATRSPGESGIELAHLAFAGNAFAAGNAARHTLVFRLSVGHEPMFCQIGNLSLQHIAPLGNVTICPADVEFRGETFESANFLLLSIPTHALACFAAERAKSSSRLTARMAGGDPPLLAAANDLADEAKADFSSGPSYWNELTDTLYGHLLSDDLRSEWKCDCPVLGPDVLARINGYVVAHLSEPIDVDTIAHIAGQSRFQFPRIFRRSVGTSPYQYLVQLRLRYAIEMIRGRERSLAEVAAETGFFDQSHLCRWVKRVYGVSPGHFGKRLHKRSISSRNLQDT